MATPPPPPPQRTPLPAPVRWLLLLGAVLCLALGVVGIFIPGLPTTVFILMAAWAAARSSPRLYEWLWCHPLFGLMLRNWVNGGCVNRRAKWSATALMTVSAIVCWLLRRTCGLWYWPTPAWPACCCGCGCAPSRHNAGVGKIEWLLKSCSIFRI